MAIAGAMKVAGKALGKAVKVIKKKKKQLETKGRRTKQILKKKQSDKVADLALEDPTGGSLKDQVKKATRNIRAINKIPNVAAGAGATATQVGKKAVKATKSKVRNFKKSPAGIATTASLKSIDETTGGFVSGRNIAAVAGIAGALGLTQSIIKSNTSPFQLYTYDKMADGRYALNFKGGNANSVFTARHLNPKEVDDVRTRLAVLDSILDSADPRKRSAEFKEQVNYLAKKYKVSNITGKKLSVIIPNIEGGVQRTG